MKRFVCLLALATFAAVVPGYSQSATDRAVAEISGIHRPTPTPGSGGTTAKPTGPMEAALYKDDKGKTAATAFGVNDTVYLVAKNVSASKGDKLGVVWYMEKGGKTKKVFDSASAAPGTGVYNPSYNLPPAKPASPAGAYYVELTQNGKVLKKLSFTIK